MRKIILFLLIAVILGFVDAYVFAGSSDMEDIERLEKYVKEGKELLLKRNYTAALDKFMMAHSIDPWDDDINILIEEALENIKKLDNEIYKGFKLLDEARVEEASNVFKSLKDKLSSEDEELLRLLNDGFERVREYRREEYIKRIEQSGIEYMDEGRAGRIALLEEKIRKEEFSRKVKSIRRQAMSLFDSGDYESSRKGWEALLELMPYDEEAQDFISKIDSELREQKRLLEIAEGYFRSGESLFREKRYEEAAEQFENAIGMDFRVEESKQYLKKVEIVLLEMRRMQEERARRIMQIRIEAYNLFENGEYETSKDRWEALLELVPDDEEALLFLSKIDFKLKEKARLLEIAEGYFRNGESLFKERRYDEAAEQFENAIAMDFRVQEASDYIKKIEGILIEKKRTEDERRAEKIEKLLREGIKYYNLNQFKRSLSVLNEALQLDQENSQIREYIVRDIIALKREEQKEVSPSSPFYRLVENLNRLGKIAYQSGEYRDAVKYYEEILLIFPFNENARINLTRSLSKTDPGLVKDILNTMYREALGLIQQDKEREARIKLNLILDVDPGFSKARDKLEELEKEKIPEEKVVTEADRARAMELHLYGLGLYRSENLEEAVNVWKRAVELDPDFVDARISLARAETQLRNLQRYESAEYKKDEGYGEELRIKIKKHYLDGIHLFMNGLYREAITEWEEVLKIDPENDNARLNIKRAQQRLGFGVQKESL